MLLSRMNSNLDKLLRILRYVVYIYIACSLLFHNELRSLGLSSRLISVIDIICIVLLMFDSRSAEWEFKLSDDTLSTISKLLSGGLFLWIVVSFLLGFPTNVYFRMAGAFILGLFISAFIFRK